MGPAAAGPQGGPAGDLEPAHDRPSTGQHAGGMVRRTWGKSSLRRNAKPSPKMDPGSLRRPTGPEKRCPEWCPESLKNPAKSVNSGNRKWRKARHLGVLGHPHTVEVTGS